MYKKIFSTLFCIFLTAVYAQDPEDLTREGVELGRKQKYEESLQKLDESIKIYNVRSAKTLHNMGYVYELKGDIANAIPAYEEAVRRNPIQIPSLERLGYLYYKTGLFDKAVATGEQVLKLDPKNQEVIKWLPDAYKQKLIAQAQKQMEERAAQEEKKAVKEVTAEEEKPKETKRILRATVDGMFRVGYFLDSRGFEIVSDNGLGPNIPVQAFIDAGPFDGWEARVTTGNPYYGALLPDVNAWMEKVEGLFNAGGYYLGFGMLGNHHRSGGLFGQDEHINDYKLGMVFGFTQDKAKIDIALYPRLIMRDGEKSSGQTFDADYFDFVYTYTFDKYLYYYTKFTINEFYFFDHTIPACAYVGVYDFSIGVVLSRYNELTGQKQLSFNFSLTERMYFDSINTENPYAKFGNGQGWFGINTDKWTKGDPFSGFRSLSHVFSVGVEEYVHKNVFLYQTLGFELADTSEDHHEITIKIGAGVEL
ncbi:MAG: tetratricopeptide repeat protein [Spirochaetes bacterium]|nr:tetratricopeptide repeat protein [Spirochaetota bacterium]